MRFLCFCWRLWHRCWRHWFTLRPLKGLCSSCRKRRLWTQPNPSQTCQTSLATGSPCARFLLTLRQRTTRTWAIAKGHVKNTACPCPTRRVLNRRQGPCQTCPAFIVWNSLLQASQEERRRHHDPLAILQRFLLDLMWALLRGAHPQQFHQGDRRRLEGRSQS